MLHLREAMQQEVLIVEVPALPAGSTERGSRHSEALRRLRAADDPAARCPAAFLPLVGYAVAADAVLVLCDLVVRAARPRRPQEAAETAWVRRLVVCGLKTLCKSAAGSPEFSQSDACWRAHGTCSIRRRGTHRSSCVECSRETCVQMQVSQELSSKVAAAHARGVTSQTYISPDSVVCTATHGWVLSTLHRSVYTACIAPEQLRALQPGAVPRDATWASDVHSMAATLLCGWAASSKQAPCLHTTALLVLLTATQNRLQGRIPALHCCQSWTPARSATA
jgi:hypothetical protein